MVPLYARGLAFDFIFFLTDLTFTSWIDFDGVVSLDAPVRLIHGPSPIDQVAVELMADEEPALEHDSSTNALIRRYRSQRG